MSGMGPCDELYATTLSQCGAGVREPCSLHTDIFLKEEVTNSTRHRQGAPHTAVLHKSAAFLYIEETGYGQPQTRDVTDKSSATGGKCTTEATRVYLNAGHFVGALGTVVCHHSDRTATTAEHGTAVTDPPDPIP
jgi:hypothetical protein